MKKTMLIIAALVALAVLAALTIIAGADVPPVDQTVPAAVQTEATIARLPAGVQPGVYAARDWRFLPSDTYPLAGGHMQYNWNQIEIADSTYNWSELDTWLGGEDMQGKAAGLGFVTYMGRVEGGLVVPTWFKTAHPAAIINCGGWEIPRYWNAEYQTYYRRFLQAAANRYNADPRLSWLQVGVGVYGENQPADDDGVGGANDTTCVKTAMSSDFGIAIGDTGALSAKWSDIVNQLTAMHAAVWTKPLFTQYAPSFIRRCERLDITNYAARLVTGTVGLFAAGLLPDQNDAVNPFGQTGCGKFDPIFAWSLSPTRTVPTAFETYKYMLPDLASVYWGVLSALNKHVDILNLNSDLLIYDGDRNSPVTENFPTFRFANRFLGKTLDNAPEVWVALREHDPVHTAEGSSAGPQYGNYSFWLYQDQTVPAGRTISATTSVGSIRYDPVLTGSEGWSARRTDHASGNDYMYFRVDDGFVTGQGLTTTVVVTVTYFDRGNDNWQLQWKNAGGADKSITVFKLNSNQWKTWTWTLTDISFSGQYANGNDFRIYNGGSGDEYIHMVMLGKPKPAGPVVTPTRTRTPTVTATAGPLSVVFQQGISPSPSYTGGDDTFISNYGDPTANHGSEGILALRNSDQSAGLIKFDVTSIPGYATIESATLSLYVDSQTNANSLPVTMHKVRRVWVDMQATWLNASTSAAWGMPGANDTSSDIVATATTSATLTDINYWQDFDVTALVREWAQTPGGNNGVLLRAGSAGNVEYRLRSSDYNTPADFRPKLTVNYRLPAGATPTATRTSTPARTPTPTRTPTRTLTPTASPIVAEFQKGVSPSAAYAGATDTFISNFGDPDVNYGDGAALSLRNSDFKAALLRFDVSSVPQTVNVLSAKLSLHVYNSTNPNPLTVQAYRLLRNWTEMGATWNQAAAGAPWALAGANGLGSDRDDVVIDSVIMNGSGVWYDFDVTSIARLWVQNPGQNFGLVLKTTDGDQVEYEVWSSNYEFAPTVRPKLTIVYSTYFSGPTATATRTRTFVPSPTPTRTPTVGPATLVFQRGVGPVPGFAGVYDTYISNFGDAGANYGISSTLELRSNDVRAALLLFDLASMPATANIVNAAVSVHVDYKTNDNAMPVSLFRVIRDWGEMEATWINATAATLWSVPGANGGADRSTTPAATAVMSNADAWYDFDVTNLVRQWLANPAENKGVILKAGTGASVAYGLRSSEYFAAPIFRPKLTIQCYDCQPQISYRIVLPVIVSQFTTMP